MSCCKAFWFKIMYLIIVGAIFLAATFVSWNVFSTAAVLDKDQLDIQSASFTFAQPQPKVMLTSGLLGIPLLECSVSTSFIGSSACVTIRDAGAATCYKLKNN